MFKQFEMVPPAKPAGSATKEFGKAHKNITKSDEKRKSKGNRGVRCKDDDNREAR